MREIAGVNSLVSRDSPSPPMPEYCLTHHPLVLFVTIYSLVLFVTIYSLLLFMTIYSLSRIIILPQTSK